VAVLSYTSSQFSLFKNMGDGTFQLSAQFLTCQAPTGIDADDFSGDGHVDILVTCTDSSVLSLFVGNGRGDFVRRDIPVAAHPIGVQAFVGYGPGNPKLAVLYDQPAQMDVFANLGSGRFAFDRHLDVPSQPGGFSMDYFTPDRALGYAVVSQDQSMLSVFLRKGSSYQRTDYKSLEAVDAISSFDFRHNGVSDILVSSSTLGLFRIYLNDGNGHFDKYVDYNLPLATASGPDLVHLRGSKQPELVFQSSLNGDAIIYPVLKREHLGHPEIIGFGGSLSQMSTGHFIHSSDDMDLAMIDTATDELVIFLNERRNY
jgi:hypothetical protein